MKNVSPHRGGSSLVTKGELAARTTCRVRSLQVAQKNIEYRRPGAMGPLSYYKETYGMGRVYFV